MIFLAISAPNDGSAAFQNGATYIFKRQDGLWEQKAKLTASDARVNQFFGGSVSMNQQRLLIGARALDNNVMATGSAYVFAMRQGQWVEEAIITPTDPVLPSQFGQSVVLADDLAVIGSHQDDEPLNQSGAAYFYRLRSDCNVNGVLDVCDVFAVSGLDVDSNGRPDECEPDCNVNGLPDRYDVRQQISADCNISGVPDECELAAGSSRDCNSNGIPDECDIAAGSSADCNQTGSPDECDILAGSSSDCDDDLIPDECENDVAIGGPKFIASNGLAGDQFGRAVAISGHWAAASSPFDDDLGDDVGSVLILERTDGVWTPRQVLTSSTPSTDEFFGSSLAMDGEVLVAGSPSLQDGSSRGSAHIFRRHGQTWVHDAEIRSTDGDTDDGFGRSVSVCGDRVAVGAPGQWSDGFPFGSGAVYVYRFNGAEWAEEARLIPAAIGFQHHFGQSVSMHGPVIVSGAGSGEAAYVFEHNGVGWIERDMLVASDDGVGSDEFGDSVAVYGDTILVGAWRANVVANFQGAVYVFKRDGDGWSERDKLIAPEGGESDNFGWSVSLWQDIAAIGAIGEGRGAAYLFKRQAKSWPLIARLAPANVTNDARFGNAVALDANALLVGAELDDTPQDRRGSAFAFDLRLDCNENGVPDFCDVTAGTSMDRNGNRRLDECEPDCNANAVPDSWDIAVGTSMDCNNTKVPDSCELFAASSADVNANSIPDECETVLYRSDAAGWLAAVHSPAAFAFDSFFPGIPGTGELSDPIETLDLGGLTLTVEHTYTQLGNAAVYDSVSGSIQASDARMRLESISRWTFSQPVYGVQTFVNQLNTHEVARMTLYWKGSPVAHVSRGHQGSALDVVGLGFVSPFPVDRVDFQIASDFNVASSLGAVDGVDDAESLGTIVIPGYVGPQGETVELDFALTTAAPVDCNSNGVADSAELSLEIAQDCNGNHLPDDCDIAAGTSIDTTLDGVPDECQLVANLALGRNWAYASLPGQSNCGLPATVQILDDPLGNSAYSYAWSVLTPGDVTTAPVFASGGSTADDFANISAPPCDLQPVSDSGMPHTLQVTVVGDDFGNSVTLEAQFGIVLLGDANNDGAVNSADRAIVNAFWRTGSAGSFTLEDADVNCDGGVNAADRAIINAVWRGTLCENGVAAPSGVRNQK